MKFTLTNALILLIIFQSNVFTFYLITHPKGKKVSNLILAGFTLCLGLHFTNMLITSLPNLSTIPQVNPIFGLLYSPLFYFYAQSLIYKNLDLKQLNFKIHLFANLPLFSYALYWIADDFQNRLNNKPLNTWITIPVLIQMSVYLVLTYRSLLRYQQVLKNTQSSVQKINLAWLKYISVIMVMFVVATSIEYFVNIPLIQSFIVELIFVIILLMVMSFVYKGLRHPVVFIGIAEEDEEVAFDTKGILNRENSIAQKDLEFLKQYMTNHKPYLEPDLSLQQLAEALNLSPRYFSQLINQHLKQNFFEFINTYRVETAKALLVDPDNHHNRINEVMYEAGFNSKSTFNYVFKKVTGMTPTQYKQQAK